MIPRSTKAWGSSWPNTGQLVSEYCGYLLLAVYSGLLGTGEVRHTLLLCINSPIPLNSFGQEITIISYILRVRKLKPREVTGYKSHIL